tara:strand:- start:2797 stop:3267 length:471 start_codon:yes stop_codon:yes gene_type:complete
VHIYAGIDMPITDYAKRREALKQLLSKSNSQTQNMLVIALNELGYKSTQSSISRDLKELGALKSSKGYKLPEENKTNGNQFAQVKDLLVGMFPAGPNLLVVSTAVGAAQRVALAFDRCNWSEIVGSIGGDDTVFVATQSMSAQRSIISKIEYFSKL